MIISCSINCLGDVNYSLFYLLNTEDHEWNKFSNPKKSFHGTLDLALRFLFLFSALSGPVALIKVFLLLFKPYNTSNNICALFWPILLGYQPSSKLNNKKTKIIGEDSYSSISRYVLLWVNCFVLRNCHYDKARQALRLIACDIIQKHQIV